MKKFISILLSTVMLTATLPTMVFAKNYTTFKDVNGDEYYAEAAEALAELDILAGYEDGTFGADRDVTRAEMAAIICRMVGKEDEAVSEQGFTDYDDVRLSHWASGYINVASEEGIIAGDGDGRFRPEDEVKYEEALKMVVCAVGLGDDVEVDPKDWSKEYLEIADDNYITDNLIGWKGHASTRGDVAVMVYNGLRQSSVSNVDVGIIDGDTYYVNDELYCKEPDEENVENEDGVMFVNNELIIHADPDKADYDDIEDLIYDYDGEIVGEIAVTGTYQVRFSDEYSYDELQDIINDFEKENFVLWCSANNVFEMENDDYHPNDEKWDGQWDTTPEGDNWGVEAIKAPFAWDYKDYMSTVNVGVYDGYFQDHIDLNSSFRKRHFNIIDYNDDDGHGDHVAGTIGAAFDNNIGIAGVAPHASLFCISKCNLNGMSNMMKYKMAITMLIVFDRCKVLNFSQSTGGAIEASKGSKNAINNINENAAELSQYLQLLMKLGYKDFLICVAAGNDNNDSKNDVYAVYSNYLNAITESEVRDRIIVVGSCKNNGGNKYRYSDFSNVGNRVDVVAPGERIYSTVPNNDYQNNFDEFDRNGKFLRNRVWSGTSMATPHVSGLAAMLFSLDDSLDGAKVKKIITSTADIPVSGCNYKMIDAESAVKEVLTEVQLNIYDDDNQTLSNVKAVVDDGMFRFSDRNGKVKLYLSDGDHTIRFYKEGYKTAEIELYDLDYREGSTVLDFIEMTPIEKTEKISIPAKHDPISGENYAYLDHTYKFFDNCDSWEEAKEYCESMGGHLATITSQEENDHVYNLMIDEGYESAYFGLSDSKNEGTWKWVTNELLNYTNWHNGEPNAENSNEDYAMFYWKYTDGTWNDGDFGGSTVEGGTVFICEWDDDDDDSFSNSTRIIEGRYMWHVADSSNEIVGSCTVTNVDDRSAEISVVHARSNNIEYNIGTVYLQEDGTYVSYGDYSGVHAKTNEYIYYPIKYIFTVIDSDTIQMDAYNSETGEEFDTGIIFTTY